MREHGALDPNADPQALAVGLLAAVQGGLLLAQAARSDTPLPMALDLALDSVAGPVSFACCDRRACARGCLKPGRSTRPPTRALTAAPNRTPVDVRASSRERRAAQDSRRSGHRTDDNLRDLTDRHDGSLDRCLGTSTKATRGTTVIRP